MLVAGLVAKEPHLSGAILILCAGAAVMLVGGINWAWVIAAVGAAVGMVYVALFVIGYNTSRVTYWLNPWAEDPLDKGYQLRQSLITIGSGGLWGLGLGKSRQKFLFLPEEHNDFIFSVVCEELGLVGAGVVMLLFAALVLRGYWIALHCRRSAHHRYPSSVFQLRRHGPVRPVGGDGGHPQCIQANEANQGGVEAPRLFGLFMRTSFRKESV